MLDIYSAMADACSSFCSSNSHFGSVLNIYEVVIHSIIVERFAKGVKKRMPEDSYRSKSLNSFVNNYILNNIKQERVG